MPQREEETNNQINNNINFNIPNINIQEYINDLNYNRNNINITTNNIIFYYINGGGADLRVAGIHNQTVHDPEIETTIQGCISKLRIRYGENESFTSLEQIISFLKQKTDHLVSLGKLSSDEKRVIEINFNNLLLLKTNKASIAASLLRLAISALEDQSIAQQMCGNGSSLSSEKLINDMNDRWAGWFKSAIIDSQLAYLRDRGDMNIPADEELNKYSSCFGGSLNRIIVALNLIHPDVTIHEGQQTLANMAQYLRTRTVAIIKEFGQNADKLQAVANQYLVEHLATITVEKLKEISLELETLSQQELEQKSETLTSFERQLQAHIVRSAQLYLEIENIALNFRITK